MNEAAIAVDLDDPQTAAAVARALQPEAADGPEGSATAVAQDGSLLRIDVQAPDVGTLRAAINSVVRLLDAAQRSVEPDDGKP